VELVQFRAICKEKGGTITHLSGDDAAMQQGRAELERLRAISRYKIEDNKLQAEEPGKGELAKGALPKEKVEEGRLWVETLALALRHARGAGAAARGTTCQQFRSRRPGCHVPAALQARRPRR